jgi:hypothetical protein
MNSIGAPAQIMLVLGIAVTASYRINLDRFRCIKINAASLENQHALPTRIQIAVRKDPLILEGLESLAFVMG